MSLRWMEQKGRVFRAVEGDYRLLLTPVGLVYRVSLFHVISSADGSEWRSRGSRSAASLSDAKRIATEMLELELEGSAPVAAQGGL